MPECDIGYSNKCKIMCMQWKIHSRMDEHALKTTTCGMKTHKFVYFFRFVCVLNDIIVY